MMNADAGLWDRSLTFLVALALLFFGVAIYALVWSRREKQFQDLEAGSRSIFDDEEPEGEITDSFPNPAARPARAPANAHDNR